MLIFGYFHKSRLLYGLPAFIDQKSRINRIDNVMIRNIKRLLNITTRTNSNRLKITLGLPDLNTYLVQRLIKLKIKYENVFEEKLTLYDKVIIEILNINHNILYFNLDINPSFILYPSSSPIIFNLLYK